VVTPSLIGQEGDLVHFVVRKDALSALAERMHGVGVDLASGGQRK
jgi:hypothetical protein